MEYIKPRDNPDELARQAYRDGYYIEAIQLLHGWIENQSRSFLMLIGCIHFNADQKDTWDLTDTITLNDTLKVLRILNQISNDEFLHFRKLNSVRNKIIHQSFKEPYESTYQGYPKKDFDELFEKTVRQAYFFTNKCEEAVG